MVTAPPIPRCLLLDAGNTVVFLAHDAVAGVLRDAGHTVSAMAVREAEGPAKRDYQKRLAEGGLHEDGWSLFMAQLLTYAGMEADVAKAMVPVLRAAHDRMNLWRRVPATTRTALEQLKTAGVALGIVSNSEGQLAALFNQLTLSDYFDVIVDSGLEGVQKPDPAIFHRALERMSFGPAESLYVGDIPEVDVVGARRAGMDAVLIDPLGQFAEYDDAYRIHDLADLVALWSL